MQGETLDGTLDGTLEKVRKIAQEVSEREGCILYDLEFGGGPSGRVLRVYIDRANGLVSIDDCANVSRGLNLLLDVDDLIPGGAYDLEVSSPGLERRLSELWHFERAVGQLVRLKLKEPTSGGLTDVKPQGNLDGKLIGVEDRQLIVEVNARPWRVEFEQVVRAQVRFEVAKPLPPKGKRQKKR